MRRLVLCGLAGWLAACGRSSDTPPPPASVPPAAAAANFDPCALLTVEEIEAAVGWKVQTTKPVVQGGGSYGHCVRNGQEAAATPEIVDVGIGVCPTNMPCTELPAFASSAELAEYRRKGYQGRDLGNLLPSIEPIESLGVPAIRHVLAGQETIEMAIGNKRLAYVETWHSAAATLALAQKVLARAK